MDSQVIFTVEYPKISIVMAQFHSIFSTLLLLGVLSEFGCESRNIEEDIDIVINSYYK